MDEDSKELLKELIEVIKQLTQSIDNIKSELNLIGGDLEKMNEEKKD